jgi:hypothetical protein
LNSFVAYPTQSLIGSAILAVTIVFFVAGGVTLWRNGVVC